jgi:hypothetical protein
LRLTHAWDSLISWPFTVLYRLTKNCMFIQKKICKWSITMPIHKTNNTKRGKSLNIMFNIYPASYLKCVKYIGRVWETDIKYSVSFDKLLYSIIEMKNYTSVQILVVLDRIKLLLISTWLYCSNWLLTQFSSDATWVLIQECAPYFCHFACMGKQENASGLMEKTEKPRRGASGLETD